MRRKADKLWSSLIRLRNNSNCEVCGKPGNNPHHVIGRRNLTLRHDPANGVLLCPLHHTFGRESAHQDPVWFNQWLEENRPKDLKHIKSIRQELSTNYDYEKVIEKLEKCLKLK